MSGSIAWGTRNRGRGESKLNFGSRLEGVYIDYFSSQVQGELFALTSENAPWNVPVTTTTFFLKHPPEPDYELEYSPNDWTAWNGTVDDLS